MNYRVVFDIAQTWPDFAFTVLGSVFIGAGAMMVYDIRRSTTPTTRARTMAWFPYVFLAFAVLWTSVATLATVGSWFSNVHAMRSAEVEVVEGTVEDFVPMPAGSRGSETFTVDGHAFGYGNGTSSGAFALPGTRGGPIRAGRHVRIHARGTEILKLEMAADELVDFDPRLVTGGGVPRFFYGLPFVAIVWFPFVSFLLSFVSGWRSLATRFAGELPEGADGYLMQTGRIGRFGGFRNALNVGVCADAFSIVPMLPLGFFHPRLVIPWHEVASVVPKRELLVTATVITLRDEGRELRIYGAAANALQLSFDAFCARRRPHVP